VKAFALRNLVRNRARSALALLGLAGSTAGVVVLVAISFGARRMISDAMSLARGVMVLEENAPDPLWSRGVPADLEEKLARVPGVTAAVPEVWHLAFSIDGKPSLARGVTNMTALLGTDPDKHARLRGGGVFGRSLVSGRFFKKEETDGALISTHIAQTYKKELGSTIKVLKQKFTVTGIFETGTPIDNVILVQESRVREVSEIAPESVSSLYLEIAPEANPDDVALRAKEVVPAGVETRSTTRWGRDVNGLLSTLDPYLAAVSFVAGAIGALGVVNTMLMSVRERVRELGVLRATGWTRGDVFALVLMEAAFLGAAGGALGAVGGTLAAATAGQLLPIKPDAPPSLALASLATAVVLGALGGLYPAIYAARLDPIAAIRGGS
jgi:putative ABC transport system permease protein